MTTPARLKAIKGKYSMNDTILNVEHCLEIYLAACKSDPEERQVALEAMGMTPVGSLTEKKIWMEP